MKIYVKKEDQPKLDCIISEIEKSAQSIANIYGELVFNLDDQYKRIDKAYFRLFKNHFDSFLLLIKNGEFNSSIVVARTMLEVFMRSFYFEFIERPKGTNVEILINQENDFSNFFKMSKALDEYKHPEKGDFSNHFNQYTKQGLALYEKYSIFTHGRGIIVSVLYKDKELLFAYQDVEDTLQTIHGMYMTLAFKLLYVQKKEDQNYKLINRYIEWETNLLSMGIGEPDLLSL